MILKTKHLHVYFFRLLCSLVKSPIALTSANQSGSVSTLAVEEFSSLHHKLHSVYDAGRLEGDSRLGSTVVDLSMEGKYKIIRLGCAGEELHTIMKQNGIVQIF